MHQRVWRHPIVPIEEFLDPVFAPSTDLTATMHEQNDRITATLQVVVRQCVAKEPTAHVALLY